MSARLTVLSEQPLFVTIKKNGRGVSISTAEQTLLKHYPDRALNEWKIVKHSHSTRAFVKSTGP